LRQRAGTATLLLVALGVLLPALNCSRQPGSPLDSIAEGNMRVLHIYLLEGFAGQPVVVAVDGREAVRKSIARGPELLQGYDDKFTVETSGRAAEITVSLADGTLMTRIDVPDVEETPYLLLRLTDGRIVATPARQDPGFM
jgi:hypothetical protein